MTHDLTSSGVARGFRCRKGGEAAPISSPFLQPGAVPWPRSFSRALLVMWR